MNVDHQEIAKFEAVASRWWDLEGEFKPLHQMNPLRLEWIQRHSEGLFGKQILDVGCGGGILSESMARQGAHVLGLDMGKEPLQVARLHALESGVEVTYRQGTVEALAEELPGRFDVVTCMEMLEHVPDPASVVRACARLAKPGGQLFFSTINRNAKSWLLMILGAEQLLRLVPKGTHDHAKFIQPAELSRYAEQGGLLLQHMSGVRYNPLLGQFSLSQDVDVNYMLHCQKPE
ncbi:MAG: bifunctional 2-polyprenyl-6-hydroxyphenol methylase/3-demethylubiquinol 3-O-methyltransferase UbiG [Aeromonadaceae bacterium]|nr:bifunctional 2-polyprenyl-6-hydroxyphenol methylase/3-demethylubiquinol 3-O-methyltransferase UbiG [Aeromonadaceae bacterium]MBP8065741.1 bifunctional 2-polyprenyl-6-hydroxyphenol methylase/3-demethylubiquinol 3-O-methyltransferase UbiG [Aeromonadaceae bacterium]MBP9569597.1 bifunctional 2-polyprenyl-6-hydroxyphenol methylase/3-demethylubiquinol 3-O-methyltransferase UbiG [Aeromonadaceae bacterium]